VNLCSGGLEVDYKHVVLHRRGPPASYFTVDSKVVAKSYGGDKSGPGLPEGTNLIGMLLSEITNSECDLTGLFVE